MIRNVCHNRSMISSRVVPALRLKWIALLMPQDRINSPLAAVLDRLALLAASLIHERPVSLPLWYAATSACSVILPYNLASKAKGIKQCNDVRYNKTFGVILYESVDRGFIREISVHIHHGRRWHFFVLVCTTTDCCSRREILACFPI